MSQQAAIAIAKKRKQAEEQDQQQTEIQSQDSDDESYQPSKASSTESDSMSGEERKIDSDDVDAPSPAKRRSANNDSSKSKPNGSPSESQLTTKKNSTASKKNDKAASKIIQSETMKFLRCLQDPVKNDREWFQAHKEQYQEALENWRLCVSDIVSHMADRVPTIPYLPARDLIYRIYRDVRFSANKTPYKDNMSFSISRVGRKGPLAGIYCHIRPQNNSLICIGKWDPEREELQKIRQHIQSDAEPLRAILRDAEFQKLFGSCHFDETSEAWKKHPRQSVWGCEDMLKRKPKDVAADAENLDLLRLKSIVVRHVFTDAQVCSEDWSNMVAHAADVGAPLLDLLNDWMGYGAD